MPLTSLPGAEFDPALSPGGRRVAFSWDGLSRDNFDVYVKNIANGEMTRVTSDPAADQQPVCGGWRNNCAARVGSSRLPEPIG